MSDKLTYEQLADLVAWAGDFPSEIHDPNSNIMKMTGFITRNISYIIADAFCGLNDLNEDALNELMIQYISLSTHGYLDIRV